MLKINILFLFIFFLLKHVLGLILLMVLCRPDVHSSDSAETPPSGEKLQKILYFLRAFKGIFTSQ